MMIGAQSTRTLPDSTGQLLTEKNETCNGISIQIINEAVCFTLFERLAKTTGGHDTRSW
jgi:hypothetical protein